MATFKPNVLAGGHRLLQFREMARTTQREVERELLQRYGPEYAVSAQLLSRLEIGRTEKPPMQDLVLLGHLYGLEPNDIALYYGYWVPEEADEDEPAARHLAHTAKRLPPHWREQFWQLVEFAAAYVQEQATREEGQGLSAPEEPLQLEAPPEQKGEA